MGADAPVAVLDQVGMRRVPVVARVPVGSVVLAPAADQVGPVALLAVAQVAAPAPAGSGARRVGRSGVVVAIKTSFSRSI